MSHYKPYPKYKSSGLDWLDRVPEHWEVMRLRHIANFKNSNVDKKSYEGQRPVKLCNYTDVYNNEYITATLPFMDATASDAEIETFALKTGDVLITKDSEDPSDIGIPAIVTEDLEGVICGYHLTMIRTHDPNISAFVHRSLQSLPTKAYFFVESPGITRYGLSQDAIGDIKVCRPPENECVLIASWISRETSRINDLISKKSRFIGLLKEKRRAIITRAVMSGLDSNSRMKDSGVTYIGKIPAHWKIEPLKYSVNSITQGHSPVASTLPAGPREQGVLKLSAVNKGHFFREENKALIGEQKVTAELSLAKGDVLITRGNTPELVADVALVVHDEPNLSISDLIFRVRVRTDRLLPEFMVYLLLTSQVRWQVRIDARGTSASMVKVGQGHILNWKIPVPPIAVQREIVNFLVKQEAVLARLAHRVESSINLLNERRSALITAAVTGQIDLRGAA